MRACSLSFLILFVCVAPGPLQAADGTIPVWTQTVITQPGHYILTRDISVSSGVAITVDADGVTLDLNGHTITSSDPVDPVILLTPDKDDLHVKNGTLQGGGYGIHSNGAAATSHIRVHDLTISGQAGYGMLFVSPAYVEVLGCRVGPTESQEGISVQGSPGFSGRFIDNVVVDPGDKGIELQYLHEGEVAGNIVTQHQEHDHGLYLSSCRANRIEANIVSSELDGGHSGIYADCDDSVISGNLSRGFTYGIEVRGNGNRVISNEANDNSNDGIYVSGTDNYVFDNMCHGNAGYGIRFGDGNGHAYRDNMLRGNSLGAVGGAPNTDVGGNIF